MKEKGLVLMNADFLGEYNLKGTFNTAESKK